MAPTHCRRSTVLAILCAALAACSSDKSTGPPAAVAGTWTFSYDVTNGSVVGSCRENSTMTTTQSGSTLTGTVTSGSASCTIDNTTTTSNPVGTTITNGQVSGSTVTFTKGTCNFTGTASGKPAPTDALSGTATCTETISGETLSFTGTWQVTM